MLYRSLSEIVHLVHCLVILQIQFSSGLSRCSKFWRLSWVSSSLYITNGDFQHWESWSVFIFTVERWILYVCQTYKIHRSSAHYVVPPCPTARFSFQCLTFSRPKGATTTTILLTYSPVPLLSSQSSHRSSLSIKTFCCITCVETPTYYDSFDVLLECRDVETLNIGLSVC